MPIDTTGVVWDEEPKAPAIDPSTVEWDDEPPAKPKRSVGREVGRQLGLTARHAIEGGTGIFDLLAEPIRMAERAVGIPVNPGTGGSEIANLLGLPKPEGNAEEAVGLVSQSMVGGGSLPKLAATLAPKVGPSAQKSLEWLASKPGLQFLSSIGAGTAQAGAREAKVGPYGEIVAALLGGVAAPSAAKVGRFVSEPLMDAGAMVGASMGIERGTERLARDAVERMAGDSRGKVVAALNSATEYVSGAKPTTAEAITEANMKSPEQFGGRLVRLQKDISGAQGVEDVLPNATKAQKAALEAESARINAEEWPKGKAALDAVNAGGGIQPRSILAQIAVIRSQPGIRASKVAQAALKDIGDNIANNAKAGRIDANDLYTIRKEIGNVIGKHSKENQAWDKKMSSGLERKVQLAIDEAIEKAGGTGWKAYLDRYSTRMKAIAAHEERAAETKKIAAQVKGGGANLASGEIPQPPTLLSRPMMLLNYGLRMIGQSANDPVIARLAEAMKDPKDFAKLMSRPANDPIKMRAIEVMRRAAVMTAITGEEAITGEQNGP